MGKLLKLTVFMVLGLGLYIGLSTDKFDSEILRGKRVLVTGASTGIGEQVAYQYAKMGAKVMVTARREAALKKVVAECEKLSGQTGHHFVTADMSDLENIQKVTKAVKDALGGLDILVINHVAPYRNGLWLGKENLTFFDFQTKLNFNSYVHLATHAMPLLEESPGSSIVVVSSLAGVFGFLINSGYAGAKFALNGFFKSLRAQLEIFGQDISITLCFLGAIETDTAKTALSYDEYRHERLGKSLVVNIPPESFMKVNETAFEIVKAGALKYEDMYYPKFARWAAYPVFNKLWKKLASSVYTVVDMTSSTVRGK